MIRPEAHLVPNIFDKAALAQMPTRDGFGRGVVEAGEKDERVVVLCADLAESTRAQWFKEKFPTRFIEVGVAEQNLAALSAGLALYGKIPFIASYAAFSPGRNNEQIRTTISLNNVPVKICGMHAGVSVGPDGATHQELEDIALMRVQPNMTVIVPCDEEEARKATLAAASNGKPTYLRFTREKTPVMTTEATPFEIGKVLLMYEGDNPQATIVACGPLLYGALTAAQALASTGIAVAVLNCPTVKPLDETAILSFAEKTGAVVTVEEHQIAGGLGGAVAELLSARHPVPMEFIGVHDAFGQSGSPDELIEHYGMSARHIEEAVRTAINRKK